ncbi:MAG: Xaa-Pro peptidase family protein [Proteobacteria bacterium]|nr:Xaa-Pro peptidase family protein [Pseudomonadota bacterium]
MFKEEGLSVELPSKGEILARLQALQNKMSERGIDFAILFQNIDIFYFTATMQKSVLLVPKNGDVVFFVKKSVNRAKEETPLDFISVKDDREIINFIKSMDLKGRVGLELDVLPAQIYLKWTKELNLSDVVDISGIIREIRMIKSEYELRQIKKSGEIVDSVFSSVKGFLKEGVTELEVASMLESIGRKNGHPGVMRMRGFNQEMDNITITQGISGTVVSYADAPILGQGFYPAVPHGASLKKIEKNIPVLIDYGACYNGYITDETRPFVIGKLESFFEKPYKVALEIIETVNEIGKEGVNTRDIFNRAYKIVERAGLEDYFMGYDEGKVSFLGHGLGLEINELPVITPRHDIFLIEGMVFAIEPKFIIPHRGVIGIEVDFIVRKDHLERVTSFPYSLTVV